jgi:hypothetical protein
MQKWEYLVLTLWRHPDTGRLGVREVNTKEIPDWEQADPMRMLGQLGEDGWELVCSQDDPRGQRPDLLFKRPKA